MNRILFFISILTILFASCGQDENDGNEGYNCDNGTCTAVFDNPQYLTLADCQTVCGSSGTSGYNCSGSNCTSVSSNAQYSTLSACQNACGGSSAGYSCSGSSCISVSSNAQYTSLATCQTVCGAPPATGTLRVFINYTSTSQTNLACQGYTAYELSVSGVSGVQSASGIYKVFQYPNLDPGTYSLSLRVWCNASTQNICNNCGIIGETFKNSSGTVVSNVTTDVYMVSF